MNRIRPSVLDVPFKNNEQYKHQNINPMNTDYTNMSFHPVSSEIDIELNEFQHNNRECEQNGPQYSQSEGYSLGNHLNGVHSIQRLEDIDLKSKLRTAFDARTGLVDGLPPRSVSDVLENHANLIVAKMEQDANIMEDSPISENLRREALRDMPQCLTLKRYVKFKLSKSVSQKSKKKPIGYWKQFKYNKSMLFTKLKVSSKNLLSTMELWYGALKKIEGNFGSGIGSFFKFLRFMFVINLLLLIISSAVIVIPQIIYNAKTSSHSIKGKFAWLDICTGEGYLGESIMYYGSYTNASIDFSLLTYHMPEAYFFTMVFLYVSCVAVFGYSVAVSYRRSFIETEGGLKNVYANKIFCGWDYSISNRDAAALRTRAIYNELKELLHDDMQVKLAPSCMERFWTVIMQLCVNILLLFSYVGIGYSMWFLMGKAEDETWSPIYAALAVNVFMWVCPAVYSGLIRYEGYNSNKTKLKITLLRTFILGAVIIGVLMTFTLKQTRNCWETSLGQVIYRLIIIDFLFGVILSPLFDVVSYGFLRIFDIGFLHFDISRHTMQIIYNQSLFWVGFMFSPLLALVLVVKMLLMWYVYQAIVMYLCTPSPKSWRAARTGTWFLMMAFLSLLIILGVHAYIFSSIPCSICGPFQDYSRIFEFFTEGLLNFKTNSQTYKYLTLVTKPGFISLLLVAMGCCVYYLRAKALAQHDLVMIYRNMIGWEARDKQYLLQKINSIAKGWHYDQSMSRVMDPMMFAPRFNNFNDKNEESSNDDVISNPSPTSTDRIYTPSGPQSSDIPYKKYQ